MKADLAQKFKVRLNGKWRDSEIKAAYDAIELVGLRFASSSGSGVAASEAFRSIFDRITLQWEGSSGQCGAAIDVDSGGCTDNAHQIRFWSLSGHGQNDSSRMIKNVVHELGHAYNASIGYAASIDLDNNYSQLRANRALFLRPNPSDPKHYDWQQHPPQMDANGWTGTETFGDMFIAWTYNAWNTNVAIENVSAVHAAQTFLNKYQLPGP